MSNLIQKHTQLEMAKSLADYYPGGRLWEAARIPGTNINALLLGLSGELLRAECFLFLYNSDFIPDTTTNFIDEWESVVGIPDDCFPGPAEASLDTRRLHILIKLAALGVQTAADFEVLAATLGFPGTQVTSGIGSGSEEVTNGTFDTDTDWTKGTGWTISSGTANKSAGVASDLEQDISSTTGVYYVVTYTVSSITGGSVTPSIGTATGVARTTNGTFQEIIIAGATDTILRFEADSSFAGSIDDVSVKSSIAPPDGRFTIVVKFNFTENKFPLEFPIPFGTDQFAILECLFTKLKPANCDIVFGFL